jgi:hypothetical protein
MNKELIDQLWQKAMRESIENGEQYTRYRFAQLVGDAEAKRMQDEGMVTIGHMREQVAKERERVIRAATKLAETTANELLAIERKEVALMVKPLDESLADEILARSKP